MKSLLLAVLSLASLSVFAIDGSLDGSKFCRSVRTSAGASSHCLSFSGGTATDNANTFFGNPPSTFTYDVVGKRIMNVDTNKPSGYKTKGQSIVNEETGVVLNKVK